MVSEAFIYHNHGCQMEYLKVFTASPALLPFVKDNGEGRRIGTLVVGVMCALILTFCVRVACAVGSWWCVRCVP